MGEWTMPIKKITVLGAGTMGAQISVQIARHGYEVSLHARHPERFQKTLGDLRSQLKGTGRISEPALGDWLKGAERVRVCVDLGEALREVDLVVEALSENLELKRTAREAMLPGRLGTLVRSHEKTPGPEEEAVLVDWIQSLRG